jgi:hypothetical protein
MKNLTKLCLSGDISKQIFSVICSTKVYACVIPTNAKTFISLSPYMTKMIHKVYDAECETKLGLVNCTFTTILLEKQTPHSFYLVMNLDSFQRMIKLSE